MKIIYVVSKKKVTAFEVCDAVRMFLRTCPSRFHNTILSNYGKEIHIAKNATGPNYNLLIIDEGKSTLV